MLILLYRLYGLLTPGYNYRGFDIANHFCEYAGYDPDYEKGYPSKPVQLHFLRSYIQALVADGQVDLVVDEDAFLEEFYVVVNRYACAAHLFWGHWAIIQVRMYECMYECIGLSPRETVLRHAANP